MKSQNRKNILSKIQMAVLITGTVCYLAGLFLGEFFINAAILCLILLVTLWVVEYFINLKEEKIKSGDREVIEIGAKGSGKVRSFAKPVELDEQECDLAKLEMSVGQKVNLIDECKKVFVETGNITNEPYFKNIYRICCSLLDEYKDLLLSEMTKSEENMVTAKVETYKEIMIKHGEKLISEIKDVMNEEMVKSLPLIPKCTDLLVRAFNAGNFNDFTEDECIYILKEFVEPVGYRDYDIEKIDVFYNSVVIGCLSLWEKIPLNLRNRLYNMK